ncbi:hypothetical protein H4W81_004790 [Nonomuraea africana]|uniref:Uncharacterized protein n=1 Tax=Nonomuraea africana TaxID=46171 RepID=A0ABR9KJ14_9ACTN|nr:hypothetical protein [Nonomuraea africana]
MQGLLATEPTQAGIASGDRTPIIPLVHPQGNALIVYPHNGLKSP